MLLPSVLNAVAPCRQFLVNSMVHLFITYSDVRRCRLQIQILFMVNKIDTLPREKLLAIAQAFNDRLPFEETFLISALTPGLHRQRKARSFTTCGRCWPGSV